MLQKVYRLLSKTKPHILRYNKAHGLTISQIFIHI